MGEMIFRFLVGGVVVSGFAVLGEIFRPKSFGGLFSAAPSIALATIGITIAKHGTTYAATESRSMILGAIAFLCYASVASWLLMRHRVSAVVATSALLPVWFGIAMALYGVMARLTR